MLRISAARKESGVSLVELMVGIAIALILLTGVLTLMVRVNTEGGETVQATRLNQELRDAMQFITREIQRAGYVSAFGAFDSSNDGAISEADESYTGVDDASAFINVLDFSNSVLPVMDLFGTVSLRNLDDSACTTNCPCILYSFDLNEDGEQGIGSGTPGANQNVTNFELFGIRHDDTNGQIDILRGDAHSCTSTGDWETITDDTINVTNLDFGLVFSDVDTTSGDSTVYLLSGGDASTDDGTGCVVAVAETYPGQDSSDLVCLQRRKVEVVLAAQLADDAAVSASIASDIKIKNDRLQTQ